MDVLPYLINCCYRGELIKLQNCLQDLKGKKHDTQEILSRALENRVSVDEFQGGTLLHFICALSNDSDRTDIVRCLVQYGANVNSKNSKGMQPICYAVTLKNMDITNLLLELGATTEIAKNCTNDPVILNLLDYSPKILVSLIALIEGKTVSENSGVFREVLYVFSNYDSSNQRQEGENTFPEDVKQLVSFRERLLNQYQTKKMFKEVPFSVWLFLKIRQYERVANLNLDLKSAEDLIGSLLQCSVEAGVTSFASIQNLKKQNEFLFNGVHYQLIARVTENALGVVFGVLELFCKLASDSDDPTVAWSDFLSTIGSLDTYSIEILRSKTSTNLLQTLPGHLAASLLIHSLNLLKTPCPIQNVKDSFSLFSLGVLSNNQFPRIADCIERLVENPPQNVKASDFFKEWLNEIENVISKYNVNAAEYLDALSTLLMPVFARVLRTQFRDATFSIIFNIRTHDTQRTIPFQTWNLSLLKCVSKTLRLIPTSIILNVSYITNIPRELIQGESKIQLIKLIGDYIENAPQSRITGAELVISFFDTHFSDPTTFKENFIPFSELTKAFFAKKMDNVADCVQTLLVLPWKAQEFSRLFQPDSEQQYEYIKEMLHEYVFRVQIPAHKIVSTLETRLSVHEKDHRHNLPLYMLLVRAVAKLAVDSYITSLNVNAPALQLSELARWFCTIGFVPNLSSLKLYMFNEAIHFLLIYFDRIKFQMPYETVFLFSLLYKNHGRKPHNVKSLERYDICPICYVDHNMIENHLAVHVNNITPFPVHDGAWKTYVTNIEKLRDLVIEFNYSVFQEKDCTRHEMETAVDNYHSIRALALLSGDLRNLPAYIGEHNMLKEFDDILAESKELLVVAKWLCTTNVAIEVKLPENMENLSLSQLRSAVTKFQDEMRLGEDTIKLLRFFLTRESTLFEAIADKYIKDLEYDQLIIDDVACVVAKVQELLGQLLDESTLKLNNLPQVHGLMSKLRYSFVDELNIAAQFFQINHSISPEDVNRLTDLLSQGFELLEFSKSIANVTSCLRHYNLCGEDLLELEDLNDLLVQKIPSLSLARVGGWLERIKAHLAGLTSLQLRYFAKVQEAFEVVDFLHRIKDFRRQTDLLSGQLQGYQFGLDMLDNIFAVRELLTPFLQNIPTAHDAQAHISLREFCMQVHDQLHKEGDLVKNLDKISTVLNHLEEIRAWFSKAEGLTLEDTAFSFVSRLWKSGYYQSNTAVLHGNEAGLSLLFTDKEVDGAMVTRELSQVTLQDLVRGMKIFINKTSIYKDALQGFVQSYKLAKKIHKLHLALEITAHPDFQVKDLRVPEEDEGPMDVILFESRALDMQSNLDEWYARLNTAYLSLIT